MTGHYAKIENLINVYDDLMSKNNKTKIHNNNPIPP